MRFLCAFWQKQLTLGDCPRGPFSRPPYHVALIKPILYGPDVLLLAGLLATDLTSAPQRCQGRTTEIVFYPILSQVFLRKLRQTFISHLSEVTVELGDT